MTFPQLFFEDGGSLKSFHPQKWVRRCQVCVGGVRSRPSVPFHCVPACLWAFCLLKVSCLAAQRWPACLTHLTSAFLLVNILWRSVKCGPLGLKDGVLSSFVVVLPAGLHLGTIWPFNPQLMLRSPGALLRLHPQRQQNWMHTTFFFLCVFSWGVSGSPHVTGGRRSPSLLHWIPRGADPVTHWSDEGKTADEPNDRTQRFHRV